VSIYNHQVFRIHHPLLPTVLSNPPLVVSLSNHPKFFFLHHSSFIVHRSYLLQSETNGEQKPVTSSDEGSAVEGLALSVVEGSNHLW